MLLGLRLPCHFFGGLFQIRIRTIPFFLLVNVLSNVFATIVDPDQIAAQEKSDQGLHGLC